MKKKSKFEQIRKAVADYIRTEGCGCCELANHSTDAERLAKLLDVPPYKDGSGYDFGKFESKP